MRRFFDVVDRTIAPADAHSPAKPETKTEDQLGVHAKESVVLVVDDDQLMREALCEYLARNDFAATGVASAKAAYERILELREHICVLITDMVIPGGGGWELAWTARQVVPDLAVLFISGAIDADVVKSASSQPYTRFLQKPFEFRALAAELRSLISERTKGRDYR
jgi:two-component system cell cycle sensor histidine kinase/response regulator CckA